MITPFEMAVSSVRVGVGVKREDGMDLKELGTKLAMVVTDPIVVKLSPVRTTIEALEQNGTAYALYNRVRVEPSDGFVPRHDRVRNASSRSIRSSPSGADRRSIREGEPLHDVFAGRFPRLRQSTDWQRPAGARSVEHADGDPDDGGKGTRDDRRRHLRLQEVAREDRHRESTVEADARLSRSRERAHHTAGGGGVDGTRHSQPRDRVHSPRFDIPSIRCP